MVLGLNLISKASTAPPTIVMLPQIFSCLKRQPKASFRASGRACSAKGAVARLRWAALKFMTRNCAGTPPSKPYDCVRSLSTIRTILAVTGPSLPQLPRYSPQAHTEVDESCVRSDDSHQAATSTCDRDRDSSEIRSLACTLGGDG